MHTTWQYGIYNGSEFIFVKFCIANSCSFRSIILFGSQHLSFTLIGGSIKNYILSPAGHMLASGSNDRQTKFWARNRFGSTAGLQDAIDDKDEELQTAEIELGNHVGIVIGRRGATIISMQRATGTKMYVDQVRRVLLIQGTEKQIDTVQKRVGALLDRVSNDTENREQQQHGMMM